MSYGLSFMPGSQNGTGPSGQQRTSVEPVQEAVRLLSLRLPSVVNSGLAPNQLMQAPGGSALSGMGGMGVDAQIEWLRKQMQQSQTATPPQAQSLFSQPQVVRPNPGVFAPADLSQQQPAGSTGNRPSTSGGGSPYPFRTEMRDGRSVGIVGPVPSQAAPVPQPNWNNQLGRVTTVSAGGEAGINPLQERMSDKYEDEYHRG